MAPDLREFVRDVPDFPKPGILFRDLTPLMRDPAGWQEVIRQLGAVCERLQPELIVGIESRGFIVGTALATAQGMLASPARWTPDQLARARAVAAHWDRIRRRQARAAALD